eukprot:2925611-Pyramimonas_sp.AAC.1
MRNGLLLGAQCPPFGPSAASPPTQSVGLRRRYPPFKDQRKGLWHKRKHSSGKYSEFGSSSDDACGPEGAFSKAAHRDNGNHGRVHIHEIVGASSL